MALLLMKLGGSGDQPQPASNPARAAQQQTGEAGKIDAAALDVKLEALAGSRPGPGETERNPFRFKPKPPPPSSAPPSKGGAGPLEPVAPPPPPGPPPITVKFIGTMQLTDGAMIALFMDCSEGRRMSSKPVREGEIIFGQYRLVKIGLTSVIVEHLDGKGRTTVPKTGQECVK